MNLSKKQNNLKKRLENQRSELINYSRNLKNPKHRWKLQVGIEFSHKNNAGDLTKNVSLKLRIFSYPSVLTFVLGAPKNHLIETVLLRIHNICFG